MLGLSSNELGRPRGSKGPPWFADLDNLDQATLQRPDQGVESSQVEVHVAVPHDVPQGVREGRSVTGRTVGKARKGWMEHGENMPENWEILVILVEFTQKQGDL